MSLCYLWMRPYYFAVKTWNCENILPTLCSFMRVNYIHTCKWYCSSLIPWGIQWLSWGIQELVGPNEFPATIHTMVVFQPGTHLQIKKIASLHRVIINKYRPAYYLEGNLCSLRRILQPTDQCWRCLLTGAGKTALQGQCSSSSFLQSCQLIETHRNVLKVIRGVRSLRCDLPIVVEAVSLSAVWFFGHLNGAGGPP